MIETQVAINLAVAGSY